MKRKDYRKKAIAYAAEAERLWAEYEARADKTDPEFLYHEQAHRRQLAAVYAALAK